MARRRPKFLAIDDESGLRRKRRDMVIDPRTGLYVHKRKGYDGHHPQERLRELILDDPRPLPNARPDDELPPIEEEWTPPND
ncbi:MAG: hypothetical protein NXI16_01250 [Alphaproteobacteria bacterium]|nr:hypothetical protein [Alphaproteobacteria bacterium]